MQTYLDCVPCFVRQAIDAARRVSPDEAVHELVLRQTLRMAGEMPFDKPPPWMGQRIHEMLRSAIGDPDPYRTAKDEANHLALSLLPELRERIARSDRPFATAVRLAIAGNVIDLGVKSQLHDGEVHHAIDEALHQTVDEVALAELETRTARARRILYLADNAGEIVMDRLLIERLPTDRVTLVVKAAPIINDATREDAQTAGLTDLVTVIDNGTAAPGTLLDACSPTFQQQFAEADLIIAKGQGNYETLSDVSLREGQTLFFLLKAKCQVIARHLGCPLGQTVVHRRFGGSASTDARDEVTDSTSTIQP